MNILTINFMNVNTDRKFSDMFTNNFSENWDSTENQDIFIKEYFGKTKVLPKECKNLLIEDDDFEKYSENSKDINESYEYDPENITFISKKTKCSINRDDKINKKKVKTSSTFSPQECCAIDEGHSINELKDIIDQKSKKKRKKAKKKEEKEVISEKKSGKIIKNINIAQHSDASDSESTHTVSVVSSNSSLNKTALMSNKFYQKLQAAKFRYLNEMLYTNAGKEALSYFQQNTDEFQDYHLGYQSQVSKWPINPVEVIIQEIRQMNKDVVIADLGCGEAKIAEAFPKRTVHSFDLIALKDCVTACDIANVPLPNNSVDVAVFCLSLMGTNWKDYIKEGYRILKLGGVLKLAEIESRIEELELFIRIIEGYGFSLENKNLSYKMFIFLNFKKKNRKRKHLKLPDITLKPCLYKKR